MPLLLIPWSTIHTMIPPRKSFPELTLMFRRAARLRVGAGGSLARLRHAPHNAAMIVRWWERMRHLFCVQPDAVLCGACMLPDFAPKLAPVVGLHRSSIEGRILVQRHKWSTPPLVRDQRSTESERTLFYHNAVKPLVRQPHLLLVAPFSDPGSGCGVRSPSRAPSEL